MYNLDKFKRQLNSVGKGIFVEYYEDFFELAHRKQLSRDDKKPIAQKLLEFNPDANSLDAQFVRINCALQIFKNGWEKEALTEIISSSHPKVTSKIKKRARELLE